MEKLKSNYKGIILLCLGLFVLTGVLVGIFDNNMVDLEALKYFTYQSNIFCSIVMFIMAYCAFKKTTFKAMPIITAIMAITIFVTFAVQNFFIVPATESTYFMSYADAVLHIFNPLFCIVAYYCFQEKGKLKFINTLYFMIYPFLYWIICALTGFEPYFFLEISKIGIAMALVWMVVLVAVFVAVGIVMIVIDKKLGKKNEQID